MQLFFSHIFVLIVHSNGIKVGSDYCKHEKIQASSNDIEYTTFLHPLGKGHVYMSESEKSSTSLKLFFSTTSSKMI